jgi:hypothetical protein
MSTLKLKTIKSLEGTGSDAVTFTNTDQVSFANPISQPGAFMFRNKIINGNFDIWQRGTSQTSNGYGSADRWRCGSIGSTKTASRQAFTLGQTDVPNNPKYFMRHVVTSVAGAGNYVLMLQKVEGVETFAGKTLTLSFWAKADSNKNMAVEGTQNFGTGGSPSATEFGIDSQLVELTTSWTKYTITVDMPSVAGKTLGTNNDDWMGIHLWFDAGSDFAARSVSLGQQSGTFDIAQVQLEEGSAATPFELRPIGMELSMCQRYYEKSYRQDVVPGSVSSQAGFVFFFAATGGTAGGKDCVWKVTKRAQPTVVAYSTATGAAGKVSFAGTDINATVSGPNEYSVFVYANGTNMYWHLTADAEL